MIRGAITTRHILSHPVMLIQILGVWGYLRLLTRCLDSAQHCFTDFILR